MAILTITFDEAETGTLSDDIELLLGAAPELLDLSPTFRRLLFEIDEGLTDIYLRAHAARRRSRGLAEESRALVAQAHQVMRRVNAARQFTRDEPR
jgi:hypothetical protein